MSGGEGDGWVRLTVHPSKWAAVWTWPMRISRAIHRQLQWLMGEAKATWLNGGEAEKQANPAAPATGPERQRQTPPAKWFCCHFVPNLLHLFVKASILEGE